MQLKIYRQGWGTLIYNWCLMKEKWLLHLKSLSSEGISVHSSCNTAYLQSSQENRSFPAAHSYLYNSHSNEEVEQPSLTVSPTQKHMDSTVVPFQTRNQALAHRSFWRTSPTARDLREMFTSHSQHPTYINHRYSSSMCRETSNTQSDSSDQINCSALGKMTRNNLLNWTSLFQMCSFNRTLHSITSTARKPIFSYSIFWSCFPVQIYNHLYIYMKSKMT